jgi:hypothetical protein
MVLGYTVTDVSVVSPTASGVNSPRGPVQAGSASRLSRRRCSLAIERHAHLIQLYLMLELGYELPDLVLLPRSTSVS